MTATESPIKIGISTCLLGENVRYNGGHARDPYLTNTLGQYFEWVPVCPEVECGLGVPRETLRLVGDVDHPRLVTTKTGIDHTGRMTTWAEKRLDALEKERLCGFIFKKNSPSSGLFRVKVYAENGMPSNQGVGLFARAFTERFPRVPVEEEGRMNDPVLRENFIERVFALKRWRDLLESGPSRGALVDFHTRHKLLLLSHSTEIYREMGRMVAGIKETPIEAFLDAYEERFMAALSLKSTVAKHANVLQHILGYFKKALSSDEKQEMLEVIDRFRKGLVPLIVPITLVNHYVRKYAEPYLAGQFYLNPHPVELKLRNHV